MKNILNRLLVPMVLINLLATIILSVMQISKLPKTAYVDSSNLINQYKGMAIARAVYKKKAASWQANIDTLSAEVQRAILEYEKIGLKGSPREKKLTEELIKSKQQQLAEYQQAVAGKARQEDEEMTRQVIEEINQFIKKFGKQNGYSIIMAATDYGNIAYAAPEMDITEQVLEELNRQYTNK